MLERSELERFLDEFGNHAYSFAFSLCGNEPDARELVQDCFVRVLERAETFDSSQSLETWFLTVMKNRYLDGQRSWARKNGLSLDVEIGPEGLTVADAVADEREVALLDRLEREECAAQVRRALAGLPRDMRMVLTMIDVQGVGYEDAAKVLGCPLGTVRSRICRARAALREKLAAMEVTA